jgi:hypothetical protein
MMGYCVSEILMTIFLVLGLSPSLATGIVLGELSVSSYCEAYESSSSESLCLGLFLFFIYFIICL